MTEQDRQRARFEAWVAEQHPAAPLDRSPWQPDNYDGVLAAWTWAAWQAATAGPEAAPRPVAGVCSIQPLTPDGRSMTQVALCGALPAGKQLCAAQALAAMHAQRTGSANAHVFATQACAQVAPAGDA